MFQNHWGLTHLWWTSYGANNGPKLSIYSSVPPWLIYLFLHILAYSFALLCVLVCKGVFICTTYVKQCCCPASSRFSPSNYTDTILLCRNWGLWIWPTPFSSPESKWAPILRGVLAEQIRAVMSPSLPHVAVSTRQTVQCSGKSVCALQLYAILLTKYDIFSLRQKEKSCPNVLYMDFLHRAVLPASYLFQTCPLQNIRFISTIMILPSQTYNVWLLLGTYHFHILGRVECLPCWPPCTQKNGHM